ncbi:MAG: carbon-nitrogen hydrolase family protein, partial [Candidatus Wallbacteria bacterium]|nr:carbon-nitrogen hydrolase family protein [Candidatus Wallbacteria bacterium]
MRKCRVCCIQISAKPLAIKDNLDKMLSWASRAVIESKPDLIVFPESITTTFSPGVSLNEFLKVVEQIPGPTTGRVADFCRTNQVDVVLPMYERQGNLIYNDALYIDRSGKIIGKYRKTHLFPTERLEHKGWSTPGNELVTVDIHYGKVGLIICYDGDFPEISRILALRGAEIIV